MDVLVGVVGFEMHELGDDQVGGLLVDLAAEEHDPIVEQPRVDVERALAARCLLDDHRDKWHVTLLQLAMVQPSGCAWLATVADVQLGGCTSWTGGRLMTDL